MQDRLVAGQFELDWDANRLIAAVTEEFEVPVFTHRGEELLTSEVAPSTFQPAPEHNQR